MIFLSLRYLRRLRTFCSRLRGSRIIKTFYGELEKLRNLCPDLLKVTENLDGALGELNASDLLDKNNGAGCVVPLIYEHEDVIKPPFDISAGVYSLNHLLPDSNYDHWSNGDIPGAVAVDQAEFLQTVPRDNSSGDMFSIMQWVVTLNAFDFSAVSIASVAILPMSPALYSNGVNATSPDHFPNVILQDYLGYLHPGEGNFPDDLGAEIRVLSIGLNLYMVSLNCDAAPSANPLLDPPPKSKEKTVVATASSGTAGMDGFRGIIYANGTVDYKSRRTFTLAEAEISAPTEESDNCSPFQSWSTITFS